MLICSCYAPWMYVGETTGIPCWQSTVDPEVFSLDAEGKDFYRVSAAEKLLTHWLAKKDL